MLFWNRLANVNSCQSVANQDQLCFVGLLLQYIWKNTPLLCSSYFPLPSFASELFPHREKLAIYHLCGIFHNGPSLLFQSSFKDFDKHHVALDILVHQKCPSVIVTPFIVLYILNTGLMVLLTVWVTQLIQSAYRTLSVGAKIKCINPIRNKHTVPQYSFTQ